MSTVTSVKEVKLFINGQYVESSRNETFEVKNPATQEVIARVHEATFEDVDRAATAAREAFEHSPWRTMPLSSHGRHHFRA